MRSLAFLMTFILAPTSAIINPENDDCTLQDSPTRIEKVMRVTHAGSVVVLRCRSEVMLNKCEGSCESSVTPSVRLHSGFRKNCRCCRDTTSRPREITLSRCFLNNREIPEFQKNITVTEITGCSCRPCSD